MELAAKECTRSDVFTGQEAYGEYTNVLNKIMEESVLSFDLIPDDHIALGEHDRRGEDKNYRGSG